jgi:serine/threonine protein kinase
MTINNLVGSAERDRKHLPTLIIHNHLILAHDLYYFKRKYKLGPEIGRGGFGVVYAGCRIEDRQHVAVKYVSRRNITAWDTLDGRNVPLEIVLLDTCKKLNGVIRIIDWYERSDGFFIVTEKPNPVCDLFDFVSDRGALEDVLARTLFKQIVETVVACKTLNVVHRDIKGLCFLNFV